jgi:predicted ArsR family transcriptional regulator
MKEQILEILRKHGKMRRRVLADHLQVWTAAAELTDALSALEKSGEVRRNYHSDSANMDCYYEWEILKRG